MPLNGKLLDALIMEERSNIYKSLVEEVTPDIEMDENDMRVVKDMEDESIWSKRLPSKKILI